MKPKKLKLIGILSAITFILFSFMSNPDVPIMKMEMTTKAGVIIEAWDYNTENMKSEINIKLWLPKTSALKFDRTTIFFESLTEAPDYIGQDVGYYANAHSQQELAALLTDKDYLIFEGFPKKSKKKNDYEGHFVMYGQVITGYKEEMRGSSLIKTPIYGSATAIAKSPTFKLIANIK
jgi:hypothetical protein